uniref:Ig-like domain-containing protein n=1 Tax=Xenopus tropicalis TaxID=8364 RepID=A0A803JUG6_XENTR
MALGMPRLSLVTFCMFGIYCAGASEEPCYGNVGDREVYAPYGSWALLNCTHNCTKVDWETRLIQKNRTKGPGWVSVEVKVGGYDIWRASDISCTVLSGREAVDNYITVIPYEIPRLVTLDMEDMLEEGKSYIITCTVHGVAPIQNLRVTILRGKEEIYNKTFKDDSRVGNITEAVTYQITAERSDNMEDFSCQATLALGTVPGNKVRSSNIPVRTFGLPQAPYFNNTHWIKIGTKDTLSCVMPNASPPDNVTLTMLFDNTRLSVNKTKMADGTVEGRATIPPEYLLSINTYQARCKAELLGLSSEDSVDIHIYEPANINLTLSNTEVLLGETIRASCVLTNEHPDQYSVVIGLNGEDVCEDPKWDCNVTVKETSPVANVTCKAFHKRNQGITYVTQQSVPVIEPANISLTLSNTEVLLGETIRVSCALTNEHPDQYSVVIGLNGEDVCEDPKWDCNVTVKETSPVANVTCKAFHKRNQGITYVTQQSVPVIEPANINLTLSNTEVLLGETIRVSCVLTNEHPDQYSVVIGLNGEDVCEDPKWDCNVTVKGTSPVANVTCKAFHKRNQRITYVTQQSVPVIGNNVWAFLCIVAFVFTGLLAMILVGTAALYLCRRKRKRDSYIVTQRRALRTPQCRTDSITS